MIYLIGLWESVRDFIATGGDVLYVVAAALFLMWVLMIERYWYLSSVFPKMRDKIVADCLLIFRSTRTFLELNNYGILPKNPGVPKTE